MFDRILIANRGEIACRIIRTCRELGVETVAVYSDADARALHVRMADHAYHIGAAAPAQSYLNGDRIIEVARQSGAQAIHPGYGFLSENAQFVAACEAAGIIFIGPPRGAVELMGSKADAKAVMSKAGVPLVPGYHGEDQDDATLTREAQAIGFPLMIKAAAGGGGKGMRIVQQADEFASALAAARREASNAFGDQQMILERYLQQPRHIEFQVFADNHGNTIHLNERECSIQRRYQKVLEESPSPFLTDAMRTEMGTQAVAAAEAVNYRGAGTVEFIVEPSGAFYFMEMNTRLQVEHPVTEMVTDLDLVEWQLRVAHGDPLPLGQEQIKSSGHAIEARIYAENPAQGFLPSTGTLRVLEFPAQRPGIRVDSGVTQGDTISVHYDPMIAKLIAYGNDREQALARLRGALSRIRLSGLISNVPFLFQLSHQPCVVTGEMDTSWLDTAVAELVAAEGSAPQAVWVAATLARLLSHEQRAGERNAEEYSPWGIADAWRLGHNGRRVLEFVCADQVIDVSAWGHAGDYRLQWGDQQVTVSAAQWLGDEVRYQQAGQQHRCTVIDVEDTLFVASDAQLWQLASRNPFAFNVEGGGSGNDLKAPMPGRIVALHVAADEPVSAGQELLILEAMKMEISLKAPHDGVVGDLQHAAGDFVEADTLLMSVTPNG